MFLNFNSLIKYTYKLINLIQINNQIKINKLVNIHLKKREKYHNGKRNLINLNKDQIHFHQNDFSKKLII